MSCTSSLKCRRIENDFTTGWGVGGLSAHFALGPAFRQGPTLCQSECNDDNFDEGMKQNCPPGHKKTLFMKAGGGGQSGKLQVSCLPITIVFS